MENIIDIFIGNKYTLVSSENCEDFMRAIGVGLFTRKASNAVATTVELWKDGDSYNLITSSNFKTIEMKFRPGEEFEEERTDGTMVRSVCTFEGTTLKQVQKAPDGTVAVYLREFGHDEMKATMTATVTCTRVYKIE